MTKNQATLNIEKLNEKIDSCLNSIELGNMMWTWKHHIQVNLCLCLLKWLYADCRYNVFNVGTMDPVVSCMLFGCFVLATPKSDQITHLSFSATCSTKLGGFLHCHVHHTVLPEADSISVVVSPVPTFCHHFSSFSLPLFSFHSFL